MSTNTVQNNAFSNNILRDAQDFPGVVEQCRCQLTQVQGVPCMSQIDTGLYHSNNV